MNVDTASAPSNFSTTWNWASKYGDSARSDHTVATTRAPSRLTRTTSSRARSTSGKNCIPCWHTTASNDASGRGRSSALAWRHSTGATPAASWRPIFSWRAATASMAAFRSTPTTLPVGPTRVAAARATNPVPQARSRAASPGRSCAASSTASTNGAMIGATNVS